MNPLRSCPPLRAILPGLSATGLLLSIAACSAAVAPDDAETPASAPETANHDSEPPAPGTTEEETRPASEQRRALPDESAPGDGKACGGFAGDPCEETEYCAYQAGQHCGAADASALCQPRPEICTRIYRPVCGCDNRTYASACTAAAAGQGVLSEGECPSSPDEPVGE